MKKLFLLVALTCATIASVSAQKDKSGLEYQNLRGPFLTNPFGQNWFIGIGGGIDGVVFSNIDGSNSTFTGLNKIGPVVDFTVGKWIIPNWGIRGQFNWGIGKDYSSIPCKFTTPIAGDPNKWDLKFNYWDVHFDAMFHFSNAVGGYKQARFYNLILTGGAGFIRSYGKNEDGVSGANNELALNFGLLNTFRLCRVMDLYAEFSTKVVRDGIVYDGAIQSTGMAGPALIPSVTFGLNFNIKNRPFRNLDNAAADAGYLSPQNAKDLQNQLAAAEARAAKAQQEAEEAAARAAAAEKAAAAKPAETKPAEAPAKSVAPAELGVVFFKIGKSDIDAAGMYNIRYVADIIKKNPDQKKVYTIVGMADAGTGTAELNKELSVSRAQAVKNALVGMGVDADRLETKGAGGENNPFELPEMNRAVIVE